MTTRQRLLDRLSEIEKELQNFTDEMAAISEQNLKKSDNEYNSWVHNNFFERDMSSFSPIEVSSSSYIRKLEKAVSYLTAKNQVKVVMTILPNPCGEVIWLSESEFERLKESGDIVVCPKCGSWVYKKNTVFCVCGHHFESSSDILEITREDGAIERHIRTGPHSRKHELVIDGKTYSATYRLVPYGDGR